MRLELDNLATKNYQTKCPTCSKPIEKDGDMIQAVGKRFHIKCFICNHCKKPLGDAPYAEHSGQVYCLTDHANLFGSKCTACGELVKGKILFALNTTWHPEHLKCEVCRNPVGSGFKEKDGKVYCKNDYTKLFANYCASCKLVIEGEFYDVLNKKWHAECYTCQTCHQKFGKQIYPFDGMPYCERHFHEKNGTICPNCNKHINGPCIRALDRAWHPDCFSCATCKTPLSNEYFPISGKAYCELHAN